MASTTTVDPQIMVELDIEAVDFDGQTAETYIAVRVGDNQKLSRFGDKPRTFKFVESAVGDRRFGKVDIFKKVGSASIGIRSEPSMMVQDLGVNCSDGAKINVRVSLKKGAPSEAKPSGKETMSAAAIETKNYLTEHNLEMLLSDAMQAVLREKPSNPSQFLADRLTQSEGTYARRAQTAPAAAEGGSGTPTKATQAEPKKVLDTESLRQQAKATLLDATASGKLDDALGKLKDSKAAAAPTNGASAAPDNTEELRQQAKTTLLEATASGKLDDALGQLKASKEGPDNSEQLRQTAKATLLAATETGKLDEALAAVKSAQKSTAETESRAAKVMEIPEGLRYKAPEGEAAPAAAAAEPEAAAAAAAAEPEAAAAEPEASAAAAETTEERAAKVLEIPEGLRYSPPEGAAEQEAAVAEPAAAPEAAAEPEAAAAQPDPVPESAAPEAAAEPEAAAAETTEEKAAKVLEIPEGLRYKEQEGAAEPDSAAAAEPEAAAAE